MKQLCPTLILLLLSILCAASASAQSQAAATHGQLRVIGNQLCNHAGQPIQLRGMSTHGLQWYYSCITTGSMDVLANDWNADVIRISMYVQEGGYETNPALYTQRVRTIIDLATARGLYALIDFHQLSPGDPMYNVDRAKTFFSDIATSHGHQTNLIYDICNEPNGVTWARIREYATNVIPVIRAIDPETPILIGTHGWASLGISDGRNANDIINNPVPHTNIMYTFHFYAASHRTAYLNELNRASDLLPIFVTEFGTQTYTGDGTNDFPMSQQYIDLMRNKKISWCNWNYSSDFRSGAVWNTGACPNGPWTTNNLKEAGLWIRERIREFRIPLPEVNITSPSNHSMLKSGTSFTIAADAFDTNHPIASVRFLTNGVIAAEDSTSPFASPPITLPDGRYYLTAVASNVAGFTASSPPVLIQIGGQEILYRETFGRHITGDVNPNLFGWQVFGTNGQAITSNWINSSTNGRPTDAVNSFSAGPHSDGGFAPFALGIHYFGDPTTQNRSLSFTPEFSFNPGDYAPGTLKFSWYQGNQSSQSQLRLIVRLNQGGTESWYAHATPFSNSGSHAQGGTGIDTFGTQAELKTVTYDPAAMNWRALNFNGGYNHLTHARTNSTLLPLSIGSAPLAPLAGLITGVGLYGEQISGTGNRRFDTFTIEGQPALPNAPQLAVQLLTPAQLRLSFDTQTGWNYRIEYKDTLNDLLWNPLEILNGNGNPQHTDDSPLPQPERYYRVVVIEPE